MLVRPHQLCLALGHQQCLSLKLSGRVPKGLQRRCVSAGAFTVTPYTLKQGESFQSVAEKRGVELQELLALNHEVNPDELEEGQVIVVPSGALSARDKEILHNLVQRDYRTFPVKVDESIEDIASVRGIEVSEIQELNPDLDLDDLQEHEIIKLPASKYSPREMHEMQGTLGMLPKLLSPGSWLMNSILIGIVSLAAYCFWLWRQRVKAVEEAELQRRITQLGRKEYKVPEDLPSPSYLASVDEADEQGMSATPPECRNLGN